MGLSPRTLRPANNFTPAEIPGLALWLDASDASSLYTTDAGPVTAVSSPTDIGSLAVWLDASDSSTLFQDSAATTSASAASDPIGCWKDKSGNDRHYTQTTPGARPLLAIAKHNGKNSIYFDGSDDFLGIASGGFVNSNSSIMDATGACAWVVYEPNSDMDYAVLKFANSASGYERFTNGATYHTYFRTARFAALSPAPPTSGLTLLASSASVATDSQALRINGATIVSQPCATTFASWRALTSQQWAVGQDAGILNGWVSEVIVLGRAATAVEVARVEKYLAEKYAISGVHAPATATSDPVGAWLDKSGNARHLTQATSASRPTLLPTGISAKPCLNFDGTDDNIWRQPGLTSDDLSILAVHQVASYGGVSYEFTHSNDTTNAQAINATGFGNTAGLQVGSSGVPVYMCDVVRSFTQIDLQGRSGAALDFVLNAPSISTQCVTYSANTSAIRKQAWTNGRGAVGNTRFNCGGWSAITLGARRNSQSAGGINTPTVFMSGRFAEVIAYSRYITDTERRRLELYLARKWSITLTGAPTVSNAEAQDWIDRVYGNGGSVSSATAAAVNTLCQSITDAGIRDRFYRLNIFAGSNLNAALTPLYLGPTPLGIRYGNTTDTNNAFVGVGTDYAETGATGGLTGNGTSKYLNTGLNANSIGTEGHAAMYHRASIANAGASMLRVSDGASHIFGLDYSTGVSNMRGFWGSTGTVAFGSTSGGFHAITRRSATDLEYYRNGGSVGTQTTSITPTAPAQPFYVFASNQAGTPGIYSAANLQAYSLGLSMTASQVAAYNTAMNAFQTALSRV